MRSQVLASVKPKLIFNKQISGEIFAQ